MRRIKPIKLQIMPTEEWYPIPKKDRWTELSKRPKGISYEGVGDLGAVYRRKKDNKFFIHSSVNHKWYGEKNAD